MTRAEYLEHLAELYIVPKMLVYSLAEVLGQNLSDLPVILESMVKDDN